MSYPLIQFKDFYRPQEDLPRDLANEPPEPIRFVKTGDDALRFFFIDTVTNQSEIFKDRVSNELSIKIFDALDKIISVVIPVIFVLLPLAMYYLPMWVPFGIGIPSALLLLIVKVQLKEKVAAHRVNKKAFTPMAKEFFHHHSLRSLHPIGEWDLPKMDERLKADRVMYNKLHKQHPKSAIQVEELIGEYDLEMNSFVQCLAAEQFVGSEKKQVKWKKVKETEIEAIGYLRTDRRDLYKKSKEKASQLALERYNKFDFPRIDVRERIKAVVGKYETFPRLYPKVKKLFCETKELYSNCSFLQVSENLEKRWKEYETGASAVAKEIAPLLELLQKEKPAATSVELLETLKTLKDKKLKWKILDLIEETHQLEKQLNRWSAEHPQNRLKSLVEEVNKWDQKNVRCKECLKTFAEWIKKHPKSSKKKCIEILEDERFPIEIKSWLKKYPNMRFDMPIELYKKAFYMREELEKVKKELVTLQTTVSKCHESAEKYTECIKAIDSFNKKVRVPFSLLLAKQGEASQFKLFLKAIAKQPAVPFAKEKLPANLALRRRKIEEIRLNDHLKKINSKMLTTDRVRVWTLEAPVFLLLAIEGVFFFYYPNPWIFWGSSVLTAGLRGLSQYVDYRLRQMDKQKQAIKLQHLLLNHPDIGAVAGTQPRLKALKEAQQRYHLEGIGSTWAHALTEKESKVLPAPKNYKEAKKHFAKLAKEGSRIASDYLRPRLSILTSYQTLEKKKLKPNQEKLNALADLIKKMKNALNYKPEPESQKYPKVQKSDYEKLIIERNQWEAERNNVINTLTDLRIEKANYVKILKNYELFDTLVLEREIVRSKLDWIYEAMQGEHLRDSQEDISCIWGEVVKLALSCQQSEGKVEEAKMIQLAECLSRLKKLPLSVLVAQEEKINLEIKDLKYEFLRVHQTLERYKKYKDYASKEIVQANIVKKTKDISEKKKDLKNLESKTFSKDELNKARPQSATPTLTTLEKLLNLEQGNESTEEFLKEIREHYSELNISEKARVWWHLPHPECVAFKNEVSGDELVRLCYKAIKKSKVTAKDIEDSKDKAIKEKEFLEGWWSRNDLESVFKKIDTHRQVPVFYSLPRFFQDKLWDFYRRQVGIELVDDIAKVIEKEVQKCEETLRGQERERLWDDNKENFIERFKKLDPYHQENVVYPSLPEPLKQLFTPFYDEYTGLKLLKSCQKEWTKVLETIVHDKKLETIAYEKFDTWCNENHIVEDFKKIDPRRQKHIFKALPIRLQKQIV